MKHVLTILLILLVYPLHAQTTGKYKFNDQWKFYKGDSPGAEKITAADAAWRTVDLPHDWSIEGPFSDEWASGTGYLPTGIGWYRKSFTLLPAQQGKTIYIYFDGVYKNSEVWINEHALGKRPNGYASFYYDITQYLNPKGNNLIAVKVDHTDFGDSRWYSGSGINRNVYLLAVEPVHIAVWGTTFTTPQVNAAGAQAELQVSLRNTTANQADVKVYADLVNAAGKTVAHAEQAGIAPSGADGTVKLAFTLNKPELWSIDHPTLYTLKTGLEVGGKKSGSVEERVGFRSFRFDANKGFFLNDESIKLKGVCFHDDAGALGSAVPKAVWRRRLETLKDLGCNSIRMSHNPHQDYMYDLCDEMGFIVQDEAFDEWAISKNKWVKGWNVGTPSRDGYAKYFAEWADRDLQDMIRRSKNHPSIVMWSIGNEIDYPNDPYTHEVLNTGRNPQIYGRGYQPGNPPASEMGVIARRLVAVAKKEDATRPITAALAGVVMSNQTDYPDALDLVGYNYQEYRYPDDHTKYPQRIIYGSENSKSYEAWAPVEELDYISAQYLWTAFDFMGEAHSWPERSSGAGLIDLAGNPKSEFYYRKSLWTSAPVTHLAVTPISRPNERRRPVVESHWNWAPGDSVRIHCATNNDEAELFLNGKSLGKKSRKTAAEKMITWNTVYQPGTLEVKTTGKTTGTYKLTTAGTPRALQVSADRTTLKADKDDAIHITTTVMDDKKLRVPNADPELTVTITGPGRLIGLESADLNSHEDYKANKRKAYKGKLLAYIQATAPGTIKVTITTPGLPSQTIQLTSVKP